MHSLESALQLILDQVKPLSVERLSLAQATGSRVAEAPRSLVDLPPFDNSAMDGYAVQAQDVTTASETTPVPLDLIDRVPAGSTASLPIASGQCARVFTGSPLPPGADAVIMQEDTTVQPLTPRQILIRDQASPWENVRFRGEDVKAGATLLKVGDLCTPTRLGLLSACGVSEIGVFQRPRVTVITTGSELCEPGKPLPPGHLYESNRLMISEELRLLGAEPRVVPVVPDEMEATQQALRNAFEHSDCVISTGGASVGELDLLKPAFEAIGGRLTFWKIAIKPGKPFVFGSYQEKLWCGLPGNPVSAFVTFLLLVRPIILALQGAPGTSLPVSWGHLVEDFVNKGDRRHFVRVTINDAGEVRSAGRQASHMMGSLSAANGLLDLPPESRKAKGELVPVLHFRLEL